MGTTQHRFLIATTWKYENVEDFSRNFLEKLEEEDREEIIVTDERTNGFCSIIIPPDGSNLGWPESDKWADIRDKAIRYFTKNNWQWFAGGYGELGHEADSSVLRQCGRGSSGG